MNSTQSESDLRTILHPERLSVAIGGFAHFELLYSACKLGIFDVLQRRGSASLKSLSRELRVPDYSLRVLLLGCSYLGLVEKRGESYSLLPVAESFLRENPGGLWPVLNAYHSLIYPAMHRLSDSLGSGTNVGLRTIPGLGRTLYERLARKPRLEKIFHDWMKALGMTVGLTEPVLQALRPTLSKVKHLVDYGGGDGANAIRICQAFPRIRVTIFDSPTVCRLATRNARKAGLADRISVREGDFLKDRFISGVDGVIFNHIFNIYSPKTNARLLKKSAESLAKGGVALVFNTVSHDTEDGPASAPVLSAYFLGLATGEGRVYALKDYDDWYKSAGFRRVHKIYLPEIAHGLIVATR